MNEKLKSVDTFVINLLYAMLYQFIFVPILSIGSYWIFEEALSFSDDFPKELLLLVLLLIINILVVYIISYIYNNLFKMKIGYYGLTGAVTLGLVLMVYFIVQATGSVKCAIPDSSVCADYIIILRYMNFIVIFLIFYYILFLLMHLITTVRKEDIITKEDKINIKNEKKALKEQKKASKKIRRTSKKK